MRDLIRFSERKDWDRRREWHEMNGRISDRLRDWKAGPPPNHPDWIMEQCQGIDGGAWMPPRYALANKPDTRPPLPFRDHESTLWQKYAILVALRDRVCLNVDPIIPKQDLQSDTSGDVAFEVACLNLRERISNLTERDHPALEKCLADVCADLKVPPQAASEGGEPPEKALPTHSDDFTSVDWFGTRHKFTKGLQAETVRVLWGEWEVGGHSLSQETIGIKIKSSANSFQLRKVFRKRIPNNKYEMHLAWGKMIQQAKKGNYHLVPPGNLA